MSTERKRIAMILSAVEQAGRARSSLGSISTDLFALDDCAVLPLGPAGDLVVGSDFIRGPGFHLFKLGILSWFDVGYYLVAANVSDLAAMGAVPLGIVTVVRYSEDMTDSDFQAVAAGIAAACRDTETPLVGGDTGGYESPVLSAAAFGICPPGGALLRASGRPGDKLYLTGTVGLAGAAIAYFTRAKPAGGRLTAEEENELASVWRRVRPALKQGQLLTGRRLASCAIDTSDGLRASCRQIAEASQVDVVVPQSDFPIVSLVRKVAEMLKIDPFALTLSDSVDFRVLFTASQADSVGVADAFKENGFELYEIGYLEEKRGEIGQALATLNGTVFPLPGVEWAQGNVMSVDALRTQPVK